MKYVLGDRAADWLRRQLAAGYTSGPAPARQRPRDPSMPLPPLQPYTVRWSDADSSLVVYLPQGACNLSGYQVLLTPATDTNWYIVARGSTGTSTDGTTLSVHAHIKGRVKATSSGTIAPAIYVESYDMSGSPNANDNAGDLWSAEIARCTVTATTSGGTTTYKRAVGQIYAGAVAHLAPIVVGDIELYWYTDTATAANGFVPFVDAQSAAPWCNQPLAADVQLSDAATLYAWYVVDCSGNTPTPGIVTATTAGDPVPAAERYYKAYALVYTFADGVLVGDTRDRLAQEVYYP